MLFFCKQKTAYEMRISDWSSDVCSSDLSVGAPIIIAGAIGAARGREAADAARKAFEPAVVLRVRSAPVRHREHLDLARDHVDQSEARARRGQAEIDDADAVGLRDIARLHREIGRAHV